ncbi:hypothetical protein V8C86DRAFT_2723506 [Haematococcus lacustris]
MVLSSPGKAPTNYLRHICVAVDVSDNSLRAVLWAAHELYREGDMLHLVHVCRYLQPQMTINHSYPGATFDIPNLSDLNEKRHAEEVKAVIQARLLGPLEALKVPASLHLYLDTDNAPASAICSTLMRVADECNAAMVVVACHDKAYGAWDTLMLGSVAEQLQRTCKRPLAIIGDYTVKTAAAPPGPLVIPMRSRHDKE